MKAFRTLLKNEFRLNVRDMNMVIFAIAMPVVVLIILGIIFKNQSAYEGANYTFLEQSFAALSSISICAGGLMGLPLVVAEYRERKILKRFQVTPISPIMLLLVQVMVYTIYAVLSLVILGILSALCFGVKLHGSVLQFIGGWLLTLVCMLSIGMLAGGIAKNSKQASVIASVLYFPMLIFSGATLPYEVMPKGLQKIADIMPMTQGIKVMKMAFVGEILEHNIAPVVILGGVTIICSVAAIRLFKWE